MIGGARADLGTGDERARRRDHVRDAAVVPAHVLTHGLAEQVARLVDISGARPGVLAERHCVFYLIRAEQRGAAGEYRPRDAE